MEATLLALGIYEDTGSLTYSTTTVRDLRCVTWLVEHGANLAVVSDFLHQPLTDRAAGAVRRPDERRRGAQLAGHTVVIATATARGDVEEISTLAHKIRDLYDPAGLFLLVDLGEHLQLVARSTDDAVDVGHIAGHFGGGGHARAAAALIRGRTCEATRQELLRAAGRSTSSPRSRWRRSCPTASTPCPLTPQWTRRPTIMLRYGFEGFPVVDDEGQIVGILSRREIDRASRLQTGRHADQPLT